MAEPEEVEVVTGDLRFTVAGIERHVPELKWRANRVWQDRLRDVFTALAALPADTADGLAAMADAERDLIFAYDATGGLGDLEDATERDIDTIYTRLIEVSFPQAQSQTALMMAMLRAAAERSAQENSTNGQSPSGTSTVPTTLRPRSRNARSSSSTGKAKSA